MNVFCSKNLFFLSVEQLRRRRLEAEAGRRPDQLGVRRQLAVLLALRQVLLELVSVLRVGDVFHVLGHDVSELGRLHGASEALHFAFGDVEGFVF